MNQPAMRRHPGFCACGSRVLDPLPMCGDCYAKEQDKQRNRGRSATVRRSWDGGALQVERTF